MACDAWIVRPLEFSYLAAEILCVSCPQLTVPRRRAIQQRQPLTVAPLNTIKGHAPAVLTHRHIALVPSRTAENCLEISSAEQREALYKPHDGADSIPGDATRNAKSPDAAIARPHSLQRNTSLKLWATCLTHLIEASTGRSRRFRLGHEQS
jgi:hypothetical protein